MPKAKIALAAVLVGSGILLVFEHQATRKLREKNQAMQQQVEQVARLGEENRRLSNLVARASNPVSLPEDQLRELLRLRGEAGPLRRQEAEVEKLQAENSRLRAAQTNRSPTALAPATSAPDYLPRESWAFVGYGDPDSALQSTFWAWSSGDPKAVVASMAPGQRAKWGFKTTDEEVAAQLARNTARAKGLRILNRQVFTNGVALFTVSDPDMIHKIRFRFKQFGSEWKFDGELKAD
jgi:hypothetical protein